MPDFQVATGRSLSPPQVLLAGLLALCVPALSGCGDDEEPPMAPPQTAKITVLPFQPTVLVGDTLRFTATVENLSPEVTWSLSAATSTTDSLGTITPEGLYKAPVRVTSRFASRVEVRATSVADPSIFGSTVCTVPRITVTMIPGSYESVLPGSILPFRVDVANAHDRAYRVFVDGIEDGNAAVGTWTTTSDTTGIYRTPEMENMVINHQIFARSVEDTTRFSLPSNVRVRGGSPLAAASDRSQFAPEWSPVQEKLAYVEGPPWKLMIHDRLQGSHTAVADVLWSGSSYDGRLAWNRDGTRVAFSEMSGGRRVIGMTNVSGTIRQVFDPDPGREYFEAVFLPTQSPDPDSLLVSVQGGSTSELRAFLASSTETGPGRLVYTAPGGREVRWPDAVRSGTGQNWIAAINSGGGTSDVITFKDDGEDTPNFVAGGDGLRTHASWSAQGIAYYWVNFIWDVNQNYYRVNHTGSLPLARLYTDLFPETGGDVSILTDREHAVSRLEDSGLHHIWIVEYPPNDFTGVPKAQELEMESIGIRGALQPSSWRRWLGEGAWITSPGGR